MSLDIYQLLPHAQTPAKVGPTFKGTFPNKSEWYQK